MREHVRRTGFTCFPPIKLVLLSLICLSFFSGYLEPEAPGGQNLEIWQVDFEVSIFFYLWSYAHVLTP